MMKRCLLPILLGTMMTATAFAGQVIDVRLNDKVAAGKQPSLAISVFGDLSELVLDLTRDDGKKIQQQLLNIPRGSKRSFVIPQSSGRHRYRGSLALTRASGESGSMDLDFTAEVIAALGLSVNRDNLDLVEHTVLLKAKRALSQVDFEVTAEDGTLIDRGSQKVQPPAKQARLIWKQKDGKVLKIRLLAYDTDNIHEDLELIPWTYHIPHQEVEFETGKWDIRDSEISKLNHSYHLLQDGLSRYGSLLEVKLYVAGHTDTVATADSNRILSEKRALAIARFFRFRGFVQPVFYQGYGEGGLKVPTPDETDEPQNRRAEYVLAAEAPNMNVSGSAAHWKRLP